MFDATARAGRVLDSDGLEIPGNLAFWFARAAFHPVSEVYKSP
jgi:hypothetical protein